jgi:hypothetical protein
VVMAGRMYMGEGGREGGSGYLADASLPALMTCPTQCLVPAGMQELEQQGALQVHTGGQLGLLRSVNVCRQCMRCRQPVVASHSTCASRAGDALSPDASVPGGFGCIAVDIFSEGGLPSPMTQVGELVMEVAGWLAGRHSCSRQSLRSSAELVVSASPALTAPHLPSLPPLPAGVHLAWHQGPPGSWWGGPGDGQPGPVSGDPYACGTYHCSGTGCHGGSVWRWVEPGAWGTSEPCR